MNTPRTIAATLTSAAMLASAHSALAEESMVGLPSGTAKPAGLYSIYMMVPPGNPDITCTMRAPGITRSYTTKHTTVTSVYLKVHFTLRVRKAVVNFACSEGSTSRLTIRAIKVSKRAPIAPVAIAGIDSSDPAISTMT